MITHFSAIMIKNIILKRKERLLRECDEQNYVKIDFKYLDYLCLGKNDIA